MNEIKIVQQTKNFHLKFREEVVVIVCKPNNNFKQNKKLTKSKLVWEGQTK